MGSESKPWTQAQAIALCSKLEEICPEFGCHVALTGGLLYKQGNRKDCDIVLYRIRQVETIDVKSLWRALNEIGVNMVGDFGWVVKADYQGKPSDFFFPEEIEGSHRYGG